LPPLARPDDPSTPAKELFGRKTEAAPLAARAIGFYSRGCVAGAKALPIDGETWQVMRLSRNRNWGHPALIGFLERLAARRREVGWNGLLVGDISQPRGGPMLTGHASHQIGLDADIWLTPMPDRTLSRRESEESMSATNVVAADRLDVDPAAGPASTSPSSALAAQETRGRAHFRQRRDQEGALPRGGATARWLSKVRPMWGHNYHFHIRIGCPRGEASCADQDPPPTGEGCDASLDWWFSDAVLNPPKRTRPARPRPPMTMAQLPPECRQVLVAQ
jgi:penicillin-insensitive murein endopeptidase